MHTQRKKVLTRKALSRCNYMCRHHDSAAEVSWFSQQLLLCKPTCTASVSNSRPHQEDLHQSSYDWFVEDYVHYVKVFYIGNGVQCLYHSTQLIYRPWNEMCHLHFRLVCTVDGRLCLYSIWSALSHQTWLTVLFLSADILTFKHRYCSTNLYSMYCGSTLAFINI